MKYTEAVVTFAEVPDHITLCINISNCPFKCDGCHSPELREDIGNILDIDSLKTLICDNLGITCVSFMGGDSFPKEINRLAEYVKSLGISVAWYSGSDQISSDIDTRNFDYIKIGQYIKDRGPIDNPYTNQIMYQVIHYTGEFGDMFELKNITNRFWRKNEAKD